MLDKAHRRRSIGRQVMQAGVGGPGNRTAAIVVAAFWSNAMVVDFATTNLLCTRLRVELSQAPT